MNGVANGKPAAGAGTLTLGTELQVNRLGYGAMRITGEGIWGPPADRPGALAVLRRAVELGVDFIDTADSYGPEVSEQLIADALEPYPDELVIATKGGLQRDGPGMWRVDGRPEHLRDACEGSLRRLRRDRIDLYQLHSPDDSVPFEESVGTLAELRAEGKVREVGLSNVNVTQLETARAIVPIVSVQNRYSLADKASQELLDACVPDGIAFIPWFPLASGSLTRSGGALDRVAAAHGASQGQVALAWLLARAPVMLPIPGTSSVAHLEENVGAAQLKLDADELAALDAAA